MNNTLLIYLLILQILDVINTYIIINSGGIELNPIINYLITIDWVCVLIIKILLVVILFLLNNNSKLTTFLIVFTSFIYTLIIIYQFWLLN